MRAVLTIHGVGTFGGRGPWQKSIDRVLGPHFKCTAIKYSHYRRLGLLTAVIEPWLLAPGIVLVLLLRWLLVLTAIWPWMILVVLLSFLGARIRHGLCLRNFLNEHTRTTSFGVGPHIIAHSMGTKLVGTVLRKYPQTRFANLILAGCVLPTDYPWQRIAVSNQDRFGFVRNEVSGRDMVPALARLGARLRLLPGFGPAGCNGFDEVVGLIHTVSSLSAFCAKCVIRGAAVAIHNVVSDEFGHSSVFDSPSYASSFWLPFLWGIEPSEYANFLELCFAAEEHHQARNWLAYSIAEQGLLDTEWGWAGNVTLRNYIRQLAKIYPARVTLPEIPIGQILQKVWQDVAIASRAHQQRTEEWETQILALNPVTSVLRSVDAILG